jgi:hypothetical protein
MYVYFFRLSASLFLCHINVHSSVVNSNHFDKGFAKTDKIIQIFTIVNSYDFS